MRIACLAFTPLAGDARVRRSAEALSEAGHDVLVIARRPLPEVSSYRTYPLPPLPAAAVQRLGLIGLEAPATLVPPLARLLYWLPSLRREALRATLAFRPDAVLCNDWLTLPVGAAAKQKTGAKLIYDSHEYATREHIQNWKWRLVSHATVQEIERSNIAHADLVITVSGGIAGALKSLYGMADQPLVIRNLPNYQQVAFVPTRPPFTILFHGVVRQERGLEELITSMAEWRFDGRIVIRGYGQPSYIAGLQQLAHARGVDDRVVFAPRVPPERLVVEAAEAHIGYLVLPSITEQYEFVLPNKLFEYLMGGLAVLATPMPDMMAVLEWSGAGLKTRFDASAIASTLNDWTPDELDMKRKAALNAARSLNWEHEKSRLTKAVARLAAPATYSRASSE